MRLRVTNFLLGFLVLVLFGCFGKKNIHEKEEAFSESIRESQYYRVFTEATKHYFFGNTRSSIALYESCIKEFPDRAASYYQLSSIYLRQQNVEKATNYALNAVVRDSANTWYKVHLANIYQYAGNLDSAILLYEEVIKIKSDDEMKYNLAMIYSEKGLNQKALDLLDSMETDNQESMEIMLMRHNVYHNMKAFDEAVMWLENINTLFPDNVNNQGMLAEYLAEIGRKEYALKVYNDILDKDGRNGLVLLSFADYFMNEKRTDSAFYYYKKAFCESNLNTKEKVSVVANFITAPEFVRENSDNIFELLTCISESERSFSYYAIFADIYVTLELFDKAKIALDSALIFEKQNYVLWEQALLINNSLAYEEEIIRISGECLTYFPEKYNLYLVRAYAYRNIDSLNLTFQDMDTLLSKDISDPMKIQAYILLGEAYKDLGNYTKSDRYFDMILELDINNLMVRNNYAYYLAVRGERLSYAEELSAYTVLIEPNNPTYLDTYGWILFKQDKLKKAKEYIEAAIRNGAYGNPEVLEHYGDIMIETGKCKEAFEAYERILAIDSIQSVIQKISLLDKDCLE